MPRSAEDARYRRHNVFANSFLALYIMISMGELNLDVLKETSELVNDHPLSKIATILGFFYLRYTK